jgi:putative colanic acid biosynthesis glycosyltransferase
MILLSIVVVTKNNFEDLKLTLDSLTELKDCAEIIIVDGADESNSQVMTEYSRLKYLKYVRGPDNGIYHGMNRGLSNSTGEYIFFLNSGDRYIFNRKLIDILYASKYYEIEWLVGGQYPKTRLGIYPKKYCDKLFIMGIKPLPHQSTIMKRTIFETVGKFDVTLRVEADQDFFLRALGAGFKPTVIQVPISLRKIGGIGDTQQKGVFTRQINEASTRLGKWNTYPWRMIRKMFYIVRLASIK